MNPKDIQTPADVVTWLKHHVEWSSVASEDMMLRAVEVLSKAFAPKPEPEWCEHCPFPKHLHGDGGAPCIGFVPKDAARCDKQDGEGHRCSLVAGHDAHHEIHTPYDPNAKPMPRAQVSGRTSV